MPDMGSKPIVASIKPIPPETIPLSMSSPLRAATNEIPSNESMKNSGEPNERTNGRTIGIATAIARAPNTAPTRELMRTAPSALPASPFRAIACPSTIVDAVVGSPGTPNRTDVISPVVAVSPGLPPQKTKDPTGGNFYKNNSNKTTDLGPPRAPEKTPTQTQSNAHITKQQVKRI